MTDQEQQKRLEALAWPQIEYPSDRMVLARAILSLTSRVNALELEAVEMVDRLYQATHTGEDE